MAVYNSNLNVLPFYPNKKYWHSNRWYTYGQMCPVMMTSSETLPFQLVVAKGVTVNAASIKRVSDDVSVRNITTIVVNTEEDNDIVMAKSQTIQALELGSYYYHIHFSDGTILVSDIVAIIDDPTQYLKIEYWNDDNLYFTGGRIDYSNEFRFVMYVKSTIGKPDYEFQEEITERLGYKFIDSQISNKVFNFSFPANEALCDAMRLIRMSDYIKISSELDSYNALYFSYEADWKDNGDIATVKASFETDTIIQKLESFNRRQTADFYNALLSNIEEPILFNVDTIAQYYREYKSNVEGKLIRELDDAVSLNDAALIPVDLGDGPAKKINFKQAVNAEIKEYLPEESRDNLIQLSKLFGIDDDGNVYVVGGRTFYTEGGLSAKGLSTEEGGGGTGGATSLGQLVNVGSWADEVPSYDRVMVQLAGQTKWTEKKLSEIGGGLDESQLKQYLTTNNYAKKSDIPSLDGYATITDVDDRIDDLINGAPAAYDTLKEIADVLQGNVDSIGDILTVLGTKADKATTLAGYGITDAYTKLEVNSLLDTKLDASVFNDLFEKVELSDGTFAIRAKYGFYTDNFLSSKGLAKGEEGGASNLSDLLDVNLTDLATNDMLKWNGEKWVNIPMSSIAGASSWDEITDKPSWIGNTKPSYTFAEITSKPTTLAGYGITDAYTKTDSDSRYVNVSGDSMTGQLNMQVNGTVPLNINNTNENQESCLRVQSGGVSKSAFGWANVFGTYMYDYTSKKYLYILNGVLRFDGNQVLDTGNYSATLDTRYVKKAGDTMTGELTINNDKMIYQYASGNLKCYVGWDTKGFVHLYNGTASASLKINDNGTLTFKDLNVWHAGNDGSGSGLDADLLDGYHIKNIQTGGWISLTPYIYDATYGVRNYWYKIATISDGSNPFHKIEIDAKGDTNYPYAARCTLYLSNYNSGTTKSVTISEAESNSNYGKIEVCMDTSGNVYIRALNIQWASYLRYRILYGSYGTVYESPTKTETKPANTSTAITSGGIKFNTAKAFEYFDNYLHGTSLKALKLNTARTIWGQPFDGTANVSGALTGVTDITASGTANIHGLQLFNSNSSYRINANFNGNIGRIYNTTSNGSSSGVLYIGSTGGSALNISSTYNVGIGTPSPSYKLHVAGDTAVNRLKITDTDSVKHIEFSRGGANYITAPSGGGIYFITNGKTVGGGNSELAITSGLITPGTTTNVTSLGSSSCRWSNVYSVLGNFSSAVTMSSTLNVSGKLTVNGGASVTGGFTSVNAAYVNGSYIFLANAPAGKGIYFENLSNGICSFGHHSNYIGSNVVFQTNVVSNNIVFYGGMSIKKYLEVTGTIHSSTGIYTEGYMTAKTTSDIRLKTILNKVDYQQKLLDLGSVVNFKYNDIALKRNKGAVDDKEHIGLIYQNAVKLNLVNFCHKDIDGFGSINYIASDYINLIAGACQLNILGLRTLSKRTETLEQRVARLEKENIELKQKLNAYEKSNPMVS